MPDELRDWGLEGHITTHKFGGAVKISNVELDRMIAEAERPRLPKYANRPV